MTVFRRSLALAGVPPFNPIAHNGIFALTYNGNPRPALAAPRSRQVQGFYMQFFILQMNLSWAPLHVLLQRPIQDPVHARDRHQFCLHGLAKDACLSVAGDTCQRPSP